MKVERIKKQIRWYILPAIRDWWRKITHTLNKPPWCAKIKPSDTPTEGLEHFQPQTENDMCLYLSLNGYPMPGNCWGCRFYHKY
jgi:hypothetical protein